MHASEQIARVIKNQFNDKYKHLYIGYNSIAQGHVIRLWEEQFDLQTHQPVGFVEVIIIATIIVRDAVVEVDSGGSCLQSSIYAWQGDDPRGRRQFDLQSPDAMDEFLQHMRKLGIID